MRKIVTVTRTVVLLAVAAVLVGTSLSVASAASAAPAPAAKPAARELRANFGAIAISVDQAWGVSYDYRTKRGAKRSALKRCKNHSEYPGYCRVTGWVKNGCAATAVKVNGDGFVTRYSLHPAPGEAEGPQCAEPSAQPADLGVHHPLSSGRVRPHEASVPPGGAPRRSRDRISGGEWCRR